MNRAPTPVVAGAPPVSDLGELLRTLEPVLNGGVYVYTQIPSGRDAAGIDAVAMLREREGVTLVVREEEAVRHGLPVLFRAAWITLTVHSDLEAVGLTAAFARALSDAGIGCNVIAGAHHDHIFVPLDKAQHALAALRALQSPRASEP